MKNIHDFCVILAGGQGTRLWPLSRHDKPKQFLDFFGLGESLLQQTYAHMSRLIAPNNIYVLTTRDYVPLVREQLPELPDRHILPEPMRRNTAPAVTWSVLHIYARDPDANVVVIPSDQLVVREDLFQRDVEEGLKFVALEQEIVCLGVKPTRAETGYGYIQVSEEKSGNLVRMKSFVEKPALEFATFFVESGEFYWNSGMFLFNLKAYLSAARMLYPDWATRMDEARPNWKTREEEVKAIEENYGMTPNLMLDHVILEGYGRAYVLPCSFGWADLGSWQAYFDVSPKDANGNVVPESNALCYNSRGNVIHVPQGKIVVADDISDYVIVDTKNLLLICPRKNAQNWRRYVNDARINLGEEFV